MDWLTFYFAYSNTCLHTLCVAIAVSTSPLPGSLGNSWSVECSGVPSTQWDQNKIGVILQMTHSYLWMQIVSFWSPINNKPAIAWCWTGNKTLSDPKMALFIWLDIYGSFHLDVLTHLPQDKMAAISQTIFSDAFSLMKSFLFWLKFHWSLFLRFQLTITQCWFR